MSALPFVVVELAEGRVALTWPHELVSVKVTRDVVEGWVDRVNGLVGEVLDARRSCDELRVELLEVKAAFSAVVIQLAGVRQLSVPASAELLSSAAARRVARALGLDASHPPVEISETAATSPAGGRGAA